MAEDNITPIRGIDEESPSTTDRRALRLRDDSSDSDGFTTLDLVNGLQGVCYALDQIAGESDAELIHRLSMAAKILSTMLADRVEI